MFGTVSIFLMCRIFLFIFLAPLILPAQDISDIFKIKNPESKQSKKCKKYLEVYKKLPSEVRYNVKVIEGEIIFYFPNEDHFRKIFNKKYDGIAIDIIRREQFDCGLENQLTIHGRFGEVHFLQSFGLISGLLWNKVH